MVKRSMASLPQKIGIVLIVIGLWGLSPWLGGILYSVVQVGPVTASGIPPYDATKIAVSSIVLIAGIALLLEKIPFVKS